MKRGFEAACSAIYKAGTDVQGNEKKPTIIIKNQE